MAVSGTMNSRRENADRSMAAMEATTADLESVDFGLGMLTSDEQDALFSLLRGVRVAAGDFVEGPDERPS